MKKLIIKTALITFAAAIGLVFAVFGCLSLFAPSVMCSFTASIGLKGISGEYAYSTYLSSGELEYLAYSCEIASEQGAKTAIERYEKLIGEEGFLTYCAQADENRANNSSAPQNVGSFEQYCYGNYARALLRDGRGLEAISFVLSKLGASFPANNCAISLAVEGISMGDKQFCTALKDGLTALSVSAEDGLLKSEIITILEEYINE